MGGDGSFADTARRVVTILRTGALPFPIEAISTDIP
jgi:preprotein translocase subunit SecD